MNAGGVLNPAAIIQSTVALVAAITCTDIVRDVIAGIKPVIGYRTALYRLILSVVVILSVLMIFNMHIGSVGVQPLQLNQPVNHQSTESLQNR